MLVVNETKLSSAALLTLLQTNTSITSLFFDNNDPVSGQRLEAELVKNEACRRANAAASLDLLTRLAFTADQTGTLINCASTPNPVPGRLPQASIPAELHDILAANCSNDLLAVLAGMMDGWRQ
jgi:hypothetical protein